MWYNGQRMGALTRSIARNTAIHSLGKLLNLPIVLIVVAIMARSLGPEGFGGYSTVIAFLQFFGITANFGLLLTANRLLGEISSSPPPRKEEDAKRGGLAAKMLRNPSRHGANEVSERGRAQAAASTLGEPTAVFAQGYPAQHPFDKSHLMSNLLTLRFFSSLVFLTIAPLIALLFPYPTVVKQAMFITALSFLAISLAETLVPLFQKELRMGYVAVAEIIARLVLLAGVALAAYFHAGLLWFMVAIVIGSAAQFILMRIFTGKFVHLQWAFDWPLWRRIIKISWPIGISILFNLVYLKADTVILSALRSQTEVGFYGAAYRVLDQLTAFATMFIGLIMAPITAAWVSRDQVKFQRIYQRAFDAYAVIAFPLLVAAWIIGKPLMAFVAGAEFTVSGDILAVLMVGMTFVFFSTLWGHVVVVINKQRPMIWGYVATAILGLTAYAFTIPRFGIWGAAWSTVGAEALIMILTAIMVWRTTRASLEFPVFFKSLFSSIILGFFLYLTRTMNLVIPIFGGTLIYFVALYALGGIKKETLKEIISSSRPLP